MSGDEEETLSCEAFGEFLLSQGVRSSVVTAVVDNRINSELFVGLEEEDLKEVAPAVGDRIKLRKILNEARKNSAQALNSTLDASSSSADVTTNLTIQTAAQILSNTLDESTSSSTAGVSTESSPIPTASPSPYSAVPVSTSNWHLNFTIPELGTFSDAVKDAVRTGVTTFKARKEIIQVLRTYITAYTFYPKPEQYSTVCTKLLQKYPKLCDKVDPDCNYGSWKLALRNSFKNFRKGCKRGLDKGEHSIESVAKCSRVENEEEVSSEEYDEAVQQLEEEYKKKVSKRGKQNPSEVKRLMALTRGKRQEWIRTDCPLVSDVVTKFPFLQSSLWVRREFKAVAHMEGSVKDNMKDWSIWCAKVVELAKIESASRPFIKKLLESMQAGLDLPKPEEAHDMACLEILSRLLYPRGFPKNTIFMKHFERTDIDVDAEVSTIEQTEPYLVITGRPGDESAQTFVCCEKQVFVTSRSIQDGVMDLMGVYFTFDITFPKHTCSILIFIQHYVFKLVDDQPLPPATSKLVSNLQKMDTTS